MSNERKSTIVISESFSVLGSQCELVLQIDTELGWAENQLSNTDKLQIWFGRQLKRGRFWSVALTGLPESLISKGRVQSPIFDSLTSHGDRARSETQHKAHVEDLAKRLESIDYPFGSSESAHEGFEGPSIFEMTFSKKSKTFLDNP